MQRVVAAAQASLNSGVAAPPFLLQERFFVFAFTGWGGVGGSFDGWGWYVCRDSHVRIDVRQWYDSSRTPRVGGQIRD